MIRCSTALLVLALGLLPAAAQDAAAPAPAAPAATPAPPATTKDGKPLMKDVRNQCREDAMGQGLKGAARHEAVAACIVKARPDKAATIKCQMDPAAKGLDKDARRAFVKDCVAKAKG